MKSFNHFECETQKFIIHILKSLNENDKTINNIDNLLSYLTEKFNQFKKKDQKTNLIYFLPNNADHDENNSNNIKEMKICITAEMTEILFENNLLNSDEFLDEVNNFSDLFFEVLYPSSKYDNIYNEILKLKTNHQNKIKIAIYISGVDSIDQYFYNNCNIDYVRLDSSITKITSNDQIGSFSGCKSLIHIEIPSFITKIDDFTFNGCSSLVQITLPFSITSIGDRAFKNCSALKEIKIPPSVTNIGAAVFSYCSSLKQIIIPDSVKSIGNNAFNACTSLIHIQIPSSLTAIKFWTFGECTSLTRITIPFSVTEIGNDAFNGCKNMAKIIIPSSVNIIYNNAFQKCSSLTEISIPSSVTEIGENIFLGCKSLVKISIPSYLSTDKIGIDDNVEVDRI